jgi:hypothetical protein
MKKWIFGLLIISGSAAAENGWPLSNDAITNTAIISANLFIVTDWAQTRYIADHPEEFMEGGWAENFIGTYPTTGEVNSYFVKSLMLMNVIGYFLPESSEIFGVEFNPKKTFYISASAVHGAFAYENAQIGVGVKF